MAQTASPELIEVFDRIIGSKVYEVSSDKILPLLRAFMSNAHTRDKIVFVLYKRLKQHLIELPLQELCYLPMMFIGQDDAFHEIYDIVEPYILNRLHELDEQSLLPALIGYFN